MLIYFNDASSKAYFGVALDAEKFSWKQPIYSFSMGLSINPTSTDICSGQSNTVLWSGLKHADYYLAATRWN
jgi:hypothetical protein